MQKRLTEEGYTVSLSREGILEIADEKAIEHPDSVATILVNAELPPTMLKVESENLESYFLRIIGVNER